jgi:hypothetical protein
MDGKIWKVADLAEWDTVPEFTWKTEENRKKAELSVCGLKFKPEHKSGELPSDQLAR